MRCDVLVLAVSCVLCVSLLESQCQCVGVGELWRIKPSCDYTEKKYHQEKFLQNIIKDPERRKYIPNS